MFGPSVTPTACRPTWRSGPGRRQIVGTLAAPSPDDSVLAQPGTRFGGGCGYARALARNAMDAYISRMFGPSVTPTACRPTWRSGRGPRQIVGTLAPPSPDDSVLAQPGTRFGGGCGYARELSHL